MKKLYIITVTAIVLAILITGTVVLAVAGSEQTADTSQGDDQTTIKIEIVCEPHGLCMREIQERYPGYMEYLKAMATGRIGIVVTVQDNEMVDPTTEVFDYEPHNFTIYELEQMYPGFLDWWQESQAQTIDASLHLPEFTMEELEAMYPGYLEYLKYLASGE